MSISTTVTQGFGSFGDIPHVSRLGYDAIPIIPGLRIVGGQLLIVDGMLAIGPDCCCPTCPCEWVATYQGSDGFPDGSDPTKMIDVTLTFLGPECGTCISNTFTLAPGFNVDENYGMFFGNSTLCGAGDDEIQYNMMIRCYEGLVQVQFLVYSILDDPDIGPCFSTGWMDASGLDFYCCDDNGIAGAFTVPEIVICNESGAYSCSIQVDFTTDPAPECCNCLHEEEVLYFNWVTSPPVDCPFLDCMSLPDLPALPWPLTKTSGNNVSSTYEFFYSPESGGDIFVTLSCDKVFNTNECDCPEGIDNCEYTLVIGCSNLCYLQSVKCIAGFPTPGFPLTFASTDTCATITGPCGDEMNCEPWEAIINT